VHTDFFGPMPVNSWGEKKRYFLTFVDDHNKKVLVYFLHRKDQAKQCTIDFVNMVDTQTESKVKVIRSDNGTEYCNSQLETFLRSRGIIHQSSIRYSPQQNGTAERMNRTILDKARAMMHDVNADERMWAETVNTAVYLINRSPAKKPRGKCPEQVWDSHERIDLSHLRIFCCDAYVHVPDQKRKKFDSKCQLLNFVGYCEGGKGYRLVDPVTGNLIESRNVFVERSCSNCGRVGEIDYCFNRKSIISGRLLEKS